MTPATRFERHQPATKTRPAPASGRSRSRSGGGRARLLGRRAGVGIATVLLVGIAASSLLSDHRQPVTNSTSARVPGAPVETSGAPAEVSETIGIRSVMIDGRKFNYCGNGSLDMDQRAYDRIIFVVHGNDRRPCSVAGAVQTAARERGNTRTLIVAPWFAMANDLASPDRQLHWSFPGWSQGDPSVNDGTKISSYELMDRLAAQVSKPRTLVGFSAGAQFTTRYAAATATDYERVVIVDPSTYLYFTPQRPGTDPSQLARCPEYNRYRYGLDRRNAYMAKATPEELSDRFLAQDVTYLLGEKDDDPHSLSMDKTCAAMTQGANRMDRGERYFAYLKQTFGGRVHHQLRRVPEVDHDAVAMFTSDIGSETLFPEAGLSSSTWPRWMIEQEKR